MIVYLAGVGGDDSILEGLEAPHVLESFHYRRNVEKAMAKGWQLFLDSGAFSAYTVGAKIDLQEYIAFIRANDGAFTQYAALDDLADERVSLRNYQTMLDAGLMPTLTYHAGDTMVVLDTICRTNCRLAIGGVAQLRTPKRLRTFFDSIWSGLLKRATAQSKVFQVHGFGVTSFDAMRRYPWTSVDSTVWIKASAYGKLLHPHTGRQIFISERDAPHGSEKQFDMHYKTMPELVRSEINELITSHNFTVAELQTDGRRRAAFNALVLHNYVETIVQCDFKPYKGIFDA